MKKVKCIFNSIEDAERARKKLLSECNGGDCSIKEKDNIPDDSLLDFYAIPAYFGGVSAPQLPTDMAAWSMAAHKESNVHDSRCSLSYIGFDEQAKHAEALLYNLGGEQINISKYPLG